MGAHHRFAGFLRSSLAALLFLALSATALPAQRSGSAAKTNIAAQAARKTAHKAVLPFIEDDYARALAHARQRNVPLFVEAWAPW